MAAVYYALLKPWDNDSEFVSAAMELHHLFEEKTRTLNATQIESLIQPSILTGASTRSFASFQEEKSIEDLQLGESVRSQELQKDRELWEKYVYAMSPFYFGMLTHTLSAVAREKFDFDVEDAFLLKHISKFFTRQSLLGASKEGKKDKQEYFIDGIVRSERFNELASHANQETIRLEEAVSQRV